MWRNSVLVLALFAVPCMAQEAPKPNGKVYWAESGLLAGASAFDWKTTSEPGRNVYEANSSWAIGRHPDNHKIVLYASAMTGAKMYLFRKTEHSPNQWIKWGGRVWIAYEISQHIRWGIHNRSLRA